MIICINIYLNIFAISALFTLDFDIAYRLVVYVSKVAVVLEYLDYFISEHFVPFVPIIKKTFQV